jgi:hypothetical protein
MVVPVIASFHCILLVRSQADVPDRLYVPLLCPIGATYGWGPLELSHSDTPRIPSGKPIVVSSRDSRCRRARILYQGTECPLTRNRKS